MCMFGREPDLSVQFDIPISASDAETTREDIVQARLSELIKLEDLQGEAVERLRAVRLRAAE